MILPIGIVVANIVLFSSLVALMIYLYRNRGLKVNQKKLLVMIAGLIIGSIGVLFAYTVILNHQIAN